MVRVYSNLKALIDERNLSIRQVSKDIDHDYRSVRQMYNDDMERFPRDLLAKLCTYLGVSPNDLLILKEAPTD